MKSWSFILPPLALFTFPVRISAADLPAIKPSQIVGSVYGTAVTATDIGLTAPINPADQFDSRDAARWELMGRIMTAFGGPVVDRFVKQHKIEATSDEIATFKSNSDKMNQRDMREWQARLVELKKELAEPSLSAEDKAKLEKKRVMYEKFVALKREPHTSDVPYELARAFILAWKTERELHRAYGGRVIFQQAGLEALDARRLLFEEAEKNGDLKFNDAGVRHMFYYYANMHHTVVDDEKALAKPWFLEHGN